MNHKNLQECLDAIGLESCLKPGLERIRRALEALGNPQDCVHTIVIGGTNGKGSTSVLTSSALVEAGHSVGTYLSPHLTSPEERFLHNLEPDFSGDLDAIASEALSTGLEFGLSYFEFLTLVAFLWSKKKKHKFLVLEVGLGGRWDATNVTRPIACAITNIGDDHAETLGPTPAARLAEKLQIIPPEGLIFSGIQSPELKKQIEDHCEGLDAVYYYSDEIRKRVLEVDWSGQYVTLNGYPFRLRHPSNAFLENAALAFLLVRIIFPKFSMEILQRAFAKVQMPGRFEVIGEGPRVILSGDHNPDGLETTLSALDQLPHGRRFVLCGFAGDKPWRAMLDRLREKSAETRLVSIHGRIPMVDPSYQREEIYRENLDAAMDEMEKVMSKDDVLLVTGSLHLNGHVRNRWNQRVRFLH